MVNHVRRLARASAYLLTLPGPRALCAFVALGALSAEAQANGRPPATTGIALSPKDAGGAQTHLLGVTFGLAAGPSPDKLHWVCEEAIGGPTGVDALLAAPTAQTLITGSAKGLYISRDGGCDWQAVPALAPPYQVASLATRAGDDKHFYVAANLPEKNRGTLFETRDGGKHFTALPFFKDGVYLYSVAVCPTQRNHLVLAASNNGAKDSTHIYQSHDGGKTFTGGPIALAPPASATPQVALDPTDCKHLLVTTLDITTNGSLALESRDGGRTYAQVGDLREPIRDMRFAPDGRTAYIAGTSHLFMRTDAKQPFTPAPAPHTNACVGLDGDTVYACGSNAKGRDGFSLGRSTDGAKSFTPLMGLDAIVGPDACPTTSSAYTVCHALWANQVAAIKASVNFDPAAEFMASEQTPSAATQDAPAPQPQAPAQREGCQCSAGGSGLSQAVWPLAALTGYLLRRRLRAYRARGQAS